MTDRFLQQYAVKLLGSNIAEYDLSDRRKPVAFESREHHCGPDAITRQMNYPQYDLVCNIFNGSQGFKEEIEAQDGPEICPSHHPMTLGKPELGEC